MTSPSSRGEGIPLSQAPTIASYSLQDASHPEIELAQAEHRIRLVNHWDLARGSRVLELGCGQGNTTAVLAAAVGPTGHVDAVDPGAPDYGAPFMLSQSQAHLSASAVGGGGGGRRRIAWHRATPAEFLLRPDNSGSTWDVAVLSHCIWYFATPQILHDVLGALRGRVGRLCVAEYALHASSPAAVPHVLAVLARGGLEGHRGDGASTANVRTPLGPRAVKEVARGSGWTRLVSEHTVVPADEALLDGAWEVGSVTGEGFLRELEGAVDDERVRAAVVAARDATAAAVDGLGGAGVRTMDVWVAVFEDSG